MCSWGGGGFIYPDRSHGSTRHIFNIENQFPNRRERETETERERERKRERGGGDFLKKVILEENKEKISESQCNLGKRRTN